MASQGKYSYSSQYGLPAGMHTLLPTKISYLSIPPTVLTNFVVNADQNNVTQLPNYQQNAFYGAYGSAYRDTHFEHAQRCSRIRIRVEWESD